MNNTKNSTLMPELSWKYSQVELLNTGISTVNESCNNQIETEMIEVLLDSFVDNIIALISVVVAPTGLGPPSCAQKGSIL